MNEQSAGSDDARALALAGDLRVLIGKLKRRLREQASLGDLPPSRMSVLARLEQSPATVTALAEAEGVRPQSMGATVAALEAAGLVSGEPDPSDGRKTIWSLTPAFRQRIEAGRAARADWLFRAIRRELDAAEQAQLAAALELVKRLVDT
ncbi:MarR family winged helix-turn-helix transcriptional regulator [Labrys monachus]|uniref:DNA-binding MarR family transcriptional regulator n=1 Tax=Labrys monachus TaxID=217067 RepID=A0ABU0FIK8_9HYPH|nr:MarR family transcriptional regulator [Labrys monachus]MDQ0394444.1 DNA-binding MarR family transcriptional regulator [Labrys monachus]